ncbi:MAG: PAS domain S-box protein [Methanotrichaceae archaeon]|nr:PAS domain S-box protein [Methanotrichaceae archaeon]
MMSDAILHPPHLEDGPERDRNGSATLSSLSATLGKVALSAFILISTYEVTKQLIFQGISIWTSHIITIIFVTLLSPLVAYFGLREYHRLCRTSQAEIGMRMRTERDLDEVRQELFTIVNSLNEAVLIHDASGKILDVNEKMLELFRLDESDLPTISITKDLSSPKNPLDELASRWQKVMRGEPQLFNWHCRRPVDDSHFEGEVFLRKVSMRGQDRILATVRDITEKKEAQEAIRAERANLKVILDSMKDGVYMVDREHRIQYINPTIQKEFGPVDGRRCYQYFHHRSDPCPWCNNEEVFAGKTATWEWTSPLNGRSFDLFDTAVRNADGSISKLEIFHDITEIVQAREALTQRESQYRAIVEDMPHLVCRFLPDGTLTFVNQNYCRYFSRTAEELLGKSFLDLIPEEDRKGAMAQFLSLSWDTPMISYEHPVLAPDGATRWQRWTDRVLFDDDGVIVEYQSIGEDITDRKLAQEKLREVQRRQMALLSNIPDMAWLKDDQCRFIAVNEPFARAAGQSPEEFVGKTDLDIWPSELAEGYLKDDREVMAARAQKRVVEPFKESSGKEIWIETIKTPVADEDGRVVGSVGIARDVTERMQAEQALREELSRRRELEAIIARSPIVVFLWRAVEGWPVELVSDNPSIFGYSPQEFTDGQIIYANIIHADDLPKISEEVDRHSIDGAEEFVQEYRVITKSGEIRWVHDNTTIRRDASGNITHFQGIILDITERKKAEELLLRWSYIFENADWGVAVVRADEERFEMMNPAYARMHGYAIRELMEMRISEVFASREIETLRSHIKTAHRKGHHIFEADHIRKDGSIFPALNDASILRDEKGEAIALVVYIQDITERKQAERELRERDERLRTIFKAAENVSFIITDALDPEPAVMEFSPGAEKIFGYSREEILGRPVSVLHLPQEAEAFLEIHRRMREERKGFSCTTTLVRKGGERFPALFTTYPLFDDEGRMYAALGVSIDITDRIKIEEELLVAKEAAEDASRAKSDFLANMSHELRTPLNAVIGMAGLLIETALSAEQMEYVETISKSGDALLSVISDILDFSKIEEGKLELEMRTISLRETIEESLDQVAVRASEKGLELAYEMGDAPRTILGDRARLRQILVNLLANAVKFTDSGEVVVMAGRKNGGLIHISVRDTGIGIPKERMDRLFQSFSQVDASMTRRYGGTGLGLAISKRLVEMMGGNIWAESTPGKGSVFHFTIAAEEVKGREVQIPPNYLRGMRSLVVDDNRSNRQILEKQLRSWGMVPVLASSGEEALGLIRQGEEFDLAILDQMMPGMDGTHLAEEIARMGRKAGPIIMLTSLGHKVASPAVSAILTKPVKPRELQEALAGLLGEELTVIAPAKPKIDPHLSERFPLQILLAEDNPVNQKVVIRMLKRMGYKPDAVSNGLKAIQALKERSYDLILMDIQMPEMDGMEATRLIRERHPGGQNPQIIAMTAYALEGDKERCLEGGMDDYVSKPVRIEELVSALVRAFNARGRKPSGLKPSS